MCDVVNALVDYIKSEVSKYPELLAKVVVKSVHSADIKLFYIDKLNRICVGHMLVRDTHIVFHRFMADSFAGNEVKSFAFTDFSDPQLADVINSFVASLAVMPNILV